MKCKQPVHFKLEGPNVFKWYLITWKLNMGWGIAKEGHAKNDLKIGRAQTFHSAGDCQCQDLSGESSRYCTCFLCCLEAKAGHGLEVWWHLQVRRFGISSYSILCIESPRRPEWMTHDPEIFYGFWGACIMAKKRNFYSFRFSPLRSDVTWDAKPIGLTEFVRLQRLSRHPASRGMLRRVGRLPIMWDSQSSNSSPKCSHKRV